MKYCRCHKSSTFPLCDGSHVAHNAATGDNVGPLVVMNKPEIRGTSPLAPIPGFVPKLDDSDAACAAGRASNYGVPSNVPGDNPTKRVDVVSSLLSLELHQLHQYSCSLP